MNIWFDYSLLPVYTRSTSGLRVETYNMLHIEALSYSNLRKIEQPFFPSTSGQLPVDKSIFSVTIRWEKQGCPKIKYDVEYSIRHQSGRPKLINTQVQENFLEIKNLLPKTTISIRLRARREKNVSDFTDFARIIIPHTNETKDFTFDPDSAHQKLSLERVYISLWRNY